MQILLLERRIPLHKDPRYQDTIWGHFASWSFGTRTRFIVSGHMPYKKALPRAQRSYVILKSGQMMRTRPELLLPSANFRTTPAGRGGLTHDVKFNVHQAHIRDGSSWDRIKNMELAPKPRPYH
ncbi:hypothetical protein AVEN_111623-1 [Araneus ventricosus]|uniref:Uncharacterized protein n=1 Tax=Araneus ventricosus TaxID=182803 RepID=A0A4Y2C309_ARAVE|nr:hypothetical protein AVEN_111623-1 [Araneus ventricosus]